MPQMLRRALICAVAATGLVVSAAALADQGPASAPTTLPAIFAPARQHTVLVRPGDPIPPLRRDTAYLFERGGVWEARQIRIRADQVTLGGFGDPALPRPVLRCTARGKSAEFIRFDGHDLVVESLALDSAHTDVHGISLRGARHVLVRDITASRPFSYVIIAREAVDVTLADSSFPRLKGHALYATGTSRGIRVLGNDFGGSEWEHIVRTYSSNTEISGNTFRKPRWEIDGRTIPIKGLCVRGGRNITITDNTFDGDGMQIDLGALTKETYLVQGLVFRGNRCRYAQFQVFDGVSGLVIEDCELTTDHPDAISIRSTRHAVRRPPQGTLRNVQARSRSRLLGGGPHALSIGDDVRWNGQQVQPATQPAEPIERSAQQTTPVEPGSM